MGILLMRGDLGDDWLYSRWGCFICTILSDDFEQMMVWGGGAALSQSLIVNQGAFELYVLDEQSTEDAREDSLCRV